MLIVTRSVRISLLEGEASKKYGGKKLDVRFIFIYNELIFAIDLILFCGHQQINYIFYLSYKSTISKESTCYS